MKSCKDLQEKLLSFLKGEETSPFKKELIEKHLRQCKACTEEFQALQKTDLLLETARLSEPQKAPEKILADIINRPKKSTRRAVIQHRPRYSWVMPTAAAILFGFVLYFALQTPDPVKATVNREDQKVTLSVESGRIDLKTEEGTVSVAQGETTLLQELPQIVQEKTTTPPPQGEDQAWVKYTQGAYQEAFTLFQSALEKRKGERPLNNTALSSLHTGMGWCLYWGQDYEEASIQFQSAIEIDSNSSDAQRGVGYCHYRLGNYDLAIATLVPVGKEVPTWIDVQLTLGWAEYWTTRYSNAIPYFQAAQKLNPFLAEPSIGLGWSYYKSDQPEMARNTFINALTLYPEYFQDKDFQALLSI
ncbi:MAG: tetratricopeptide repeat protein [Planctomycetota bacterium]|nr:tetratricopeptide repeat protein [Planctomycetota bacterium]